MALEERKPAYEVLRITSRYIDDDCPAEHEPVVTMWDKDMAEQLARVINGRLGEDYYNQPIVNKIAVTVVGNEVIYKKKKLTVPVSLIASDMNEAFSIIALQEE